MRREPLEQHGLRSSFIGHLSLALNCVSIAARSDYKTYPGKNGPRNPRGHEQNHERPFAASHLASSPHGSATTDRLGDGAKAKLAWRRASITTRDDVRPAEDHIMETRFLGRSGLEVSALGFGTMTFGEPARMTRMPHLGTIEQADASRLVAIAIEAGITLFDSADVYSEGSSEEVLGRALGKSRNEIVLATKVYGRMSPGAHGIGLSRRHIIEACEGSLKRLGTDWIDLYQVHTFDSFVPIEETLRALDTLVTSGKVRYIGCSNFAGWQLMKALATSDKLGAERFISQQIQYSLMVRDAENELLPCGVDQGVGALLWSPLAQGFLSGKYRSAEKGNARLEKSGRISAYDTPQGNAVLDTVLQIAAERDASGTQVAINWLRSRNGVASVLVGIGSEAQLHDNLAAAKWSLTTEEIARLDAVSQKPLPYPGSLYEMYGFNRNPALFPRY